jgi:FlaA1/EpsC-like NDP-sugar epimerase
MDDVTYENVLNRDIRTIAFSTEEMTTLRAHRILVTGAGGSIGSRIALALDSIGGVNFLSTDRDESALHSLSLKLTATALFEKQNFLLLDIRDEEGVLDLFNEFQPTIVIHAAALKHLSVLERQPREAMMTNVYGTLNLLESAKKKNVEKFINVSTDKAANPVSVLGKSKYLAELTTAFYRKNGYAAFKSVRFGNVFGSRGSVIETFVNQIEKEKPITLTHPDVERFFMHPDEAAFLTLKSSLIDQGDVNLFNMGNPVKILSIVEKLQEILGGNSEVTYTGLRPGEKMTEDLFDGVENRVNAVPDLIDSGDHEKSLINNVNIISDVLKRDSSSILKYLKNN